MIILTAYVIAQYAAENVTNFGTLFPNPFITAASRTHSMHGVPPPDPHYRIFDNLIWQIAAI